MKLKHLISLILMISLSFTAFNQSDSLTITSSYGLSEPDAVDSNLIYHSIDVSINNIDTLNWNLIHFEVLDTLSNQIVVRKIVNRNNPNANFEMNNSTVEVSLAVLPKSVYRIFAKVRHIGGIESETIETILSDD